MLDIRVTYRHYYRVRLQRKWKLRFAWSIYLSALFFTVFTPSDGSGGDLLGLLQISGLVERLLNILLLMPLGFLVVLTYIDKNKWLIWIYGPILSILIESIQALIPGRTSDSLDIAMNSLGYYLVIRLSKNRNKRLYKVVFGTH